VAGAVGGSLMAMILARVWGVLGVMVVATRGRTW